MLLSTKLWFLFGITSLLALISVYSFLNPITQDIKNDDQEVHDREIQYSDLLSCKQRDYIWRETMPLNHLGPSLTSSKDQFLTLCPGDSFGDLKNTYLIVKNCDLELYHKGRMIWSAMKPRFNRFEHSKPKPREDCACFFGSNGDLVLKAGMRSPPGKASDERKMYDLWKSKTNFGQLKTQLKVQGKHFQIFQTFEDGSQRLFYVNETRHKFQEYLAGSKRVGGSGFAKSHAENETTILRKDEYLGDLDGLHLLLQPNCELHLINQNVSIWYFKQPIAMTQAIDCSLVIQEGKWISFSSLYYEGEKPTFLSLMIHHSFKVFQSEFVLKDGLLTIIQTLEDGSKRTFDSIKGQSIPPTQETGLKMRKEPRQIAQNNVSITTDQAPFTIERMEYIGDLDGLHLILQDNCTLMLSNGQERVWQLCSRFSEPCMECFFQPFSKGSASFECLRTHTKSDFTSVGFDHFSPSGEIRLENNHAIITVIKEKYNYTDVYYAGPHTHGRWFRQIAERSLVVEATYFQYFKFKDLSFIGDLNRVYLFMYNCSWTLYNQSQVLWKSGKQWKPEFDTRPEPVDCHMSLRRDGTLVTPYRQITGYHPKYYYTMTEDGYLWSTINTTKNTDTSKKLLTTELSVHDDWLWLINSFADGTIQKFKALQGTHDFIAV